MEVEMAYNVWETCMLVSIGLTRSECASWVQAWGSVLAIGGAFVLLFFQVRSARMQAIELERRRLLRRHNAIAAVAMFAEGVVSKSAQGAKIYCDAQGDLIWMSDRVMIDIAREELNVVRAAELESFHLVRGIRRLAYAVEVIREIDFELTEGIREQPVAKISPFGEQALAAAAQARRALNEIQQAVGEFEDDPEIAVPPLGL
jgi:hypothetical protein